MKNLLSSAKTCIILLLVTVIFLGFYAYMLTRPMTHMADYSNGSIYEGDMFEGAMQFHANGTVLVRNSNFNEEMAYRYHYKNGYVFFAIAETDEEYREEVAYINNNFEEAVNTPFYASKINAFQMISEGPDGYKSIYTCVPAVFAAVACGVVALVLVCFSLASLIFVKKQNKQK